jgi:hypothetical protein
VTLAGIGLQTALSRFSLEEAGFAGLVVLPRNGLEARDGRGGAAPQGMVFDADGDWRDHLVRVRFQTGVAP